MKTTITKLIYHNGSQFIEFNSIHGDLICIEGPFINDRQLPTGELILVHDERNENDEIVHEIYVTY